MTYVMNTSSSSLNSNRKLKYFSVEVITFNGDSFMDEIEARSSEESENALSTISMQERLSPVR